MNKTYRKNILRTVKSTRSRFLSIFTIVALGVGFLAGLLSSAPDMQYSADTYCDSSQMSDVKLQSTLGFTQQDVEAVQQTDGVDQVMAAYDTDLLLVTPSGETQVTRMHSMPKADSDTAQLNQLTPLEGRLPEKAGECVVVQTDHLAGVGVELGDVLTFDSANEDLSDTFSVDSFTVVGIAQSAYYMSLEKEHSTLGSGTVQLLCYTLEDSFCAEYYTALYLTVQDAAALDSFSDQYDELVAQTTDRLTQLGEERASIRYDEVIEEANKALDDAQKEYDEGKAEADAELADALAELEEGEADYANGMAELADAQKQIDDGQAALNQNKDDFNAQIPAAQQALADGQAQLDDAFAQLADGQAQLSDGQAQLDDAFAQLVEGQKTLDESKAQLDQTKQTLDDSKAQLDQTHTQLSSLEAGKASLFQTAAALGISLPDDSDATALAILPQVIGAVSAADPTAAAQLQALQAGLQALADQGQTTQTARAAWQSGMDQYEAGLAAWQQGFDQYTAGQTELEKNRKLLEDEQKNLTEQQNQLDENLALLNTKQASLNEQAELLNQQIIDAHNSFLDADKKLADARAEYAEGEAELADARRQLDEGWEEYNEGKAEAEAELADGAEKIADARAEVREIENCEWYVWDRSDNLSFASYDSNSEKIRAIAQVFPVFFFLVAALVVLTTMTRMVEDERGQVGTMKALGYSNSSIMAKYLVYAFAASALGSVVGIAIGSQLFPYIIITAYNIMYQIPQALTPLNPVYICLSSFSMIGCSLLATYLACRALLAESPAQLMRPRSPKAGKRVFLEYIRPVWRRMKFTHKVTARNLLRYKKRFFMTVVGIAGCTALLVTGFGVKDSISDIVDIQFNQLYSYNLLVSLKDASALDGAQLQKLLADDTTVGQWTAVLQEDAKVVPSGNNPADSIYIVAPSSTEEYTHFFQFRHRTDNEPVVFDDNAVIVNEKIAERQGWSVGDTITVRNKDDKEALLTITDICENYVQHYVFVSQQTYAETFGEEAQNNMLLCQVLGDQQAQDAFASEILKCRDIAGVQYTQDIAASFESSLSSIDYIVVVLIVSAGALAFVVLYNLTNINIAEREKELATIKVLGFYENEVAAYIFRETAILSLIGCLAGLLGGVALHQYVIRTAEVDLVMFGRTVYPLSFVWSALLTFLFTFLVCLVMRRKLDHISMVDSLKAPE